MTFNRKSIVVGTCVATLIVGAKWLDLQTRNIAGYDKFVATTRPVANEIEKASAGTVADSTKENETIVYQNYSIPISRGAIDRTDAQAMPKAMTDEEKIKRINSILKGKLTNKGAVFLLASNENGLDVFRQVAIAAHETNFGRSSYMMTHNNVGGMIGNSGKFMRFGSVDESIWYHARLLKRYKDNGRETLTDIQPMYCPVGAKNDPAGINIHWLPNTIKIYNQLTEAQ
jgi:hypothetical protein